MGDLLALVDARVNKRVVQISSVSGGSITNAFVAKRCQFEKESRDSFDPIVKDLATTVIHWGVLTKPWILAMIALIIGPILLLVLLALGVVLPPLYITLPLLAGWMTTGLLRGWLVVETLLTQRYFGCLFKRPKLRDMKAESVEHIICCTEIARGVPCYISSWDNGRLYLPTQKMFKWTFGNKLSAQDIPISGAVRASAAFPGIPPRRFSLKRFKPIEKKTLTFGGRVKAGEKPLPKGTLFLSDGGIWNNLGTQILNDAKLFEDSCPKKPEIILVINASANVNPSPSWQFAVPGWAELKALFRVALIQNANTVLPRVENLKQEFEKDIIEGGSADAKKPKKIVVDISHEPDKLFSEIEPLLSSIHWYDTPEYRKWALDLVEDISKCFSNIHQIDKSIVLNKLTEYFSTRPQQKHSNKEIKRIEDLDINPLKDDKRTPIFSHLYKLANNLEQVPTTLDKIPKETGKKLIARGYVNTLITLYGFGIIDDIGVFGELTEERLEELTSK